MTTVQQIRKRDGRVVPFHENKIADAINKAFEATSWASLAAVSS